MGSAESAANGARADAKRLGDLVVRQAFTVDERDDGSLFSRQLKECRAQGGAARNRGGRIFNDRRKGPVAIPGHRRPSGRSPVVVHRAGMHDAEHPRAESPDSRVVGMQRPERLQIGVLQNIVHRVAVPDQPIGQPAHARVMGSQQLAERRTIAGLRRLDPPLLFSGGRRAPNTFHCFNPGQEPIASRRHTPTYAGLLDFLPYWQEKLWACLVSGNEDRLSSQRFLDTGVRGAKRIDRRKIGPGDAGEGFLALGEDKDRHVLGIGGKNR